MTALVDYAISRARMIFAFIVLSLAAGWLAYTGLPKEGSPNIDIPVLYVSVNYPGVSALDAERLLVKPLETRLKSLEGLNEMTGVASEGHASVSLEFDFGFDKDALLAEVRAEVDEAQAECPDDAQEPRIVEINLSEFPILNVTLSGSAQERTLFEVADRIQEIIESIPSVLEANVNGKRDELLEIIIDPVRLETYGVTTTELLNAVSGNNAVIPAGALQNDAGSLAIKVPGAVGSLEDLYSLPLKVEGERVVTVRDLAEVRRSFEDPTTIARFNGEPTVSISVSKRNGENIIKTVDAVRTAVEADMALWPEGLQTSVDVNFSLDEARNVRDLVGQMESSVLTAICLVMIVVVAALGLRSALLVAFAIPTSFLLCFSLMAVLGHSISNMVMFGLILAVGMLVDGAIVVTEYADKKRAEGARPSAAFGEAGRRMFWPIISSTATTLCAFLPMLFWPGMPGQFMRQLPLTLIFVLSASLLVALIYLPITGIIVARAMRALENTAKSIRDSMGWFALTLIGAALLFGAIGLVQAVIGPEIGASGGVFGQAFARVPPEIPIKPFALCAAMLLGIMARVALFTGLGSKSANVAPFTRRRRRDGVFAAILRGIVGNPILPVLVVFLTIGGLMSILNVYQKSNYGVEFFVATDPEVANLHVSARGNLSLSEKDRIMRVIEGRILDTEGVASALSTVGGSTGGLGQDDGSAPNDAIGQIQFEFDNWRIRTSGTAIMEDLRAATADLPGVRLQLAERADGPQQGKPIQLRLAGTDFDELQAATRRVEQHFGTVEGLTDIATTLPLPGIEWELRIDREEAGKFGASVQSIGAMIQMVTRGAFLGTTTLDSADDSVDIRARLVESARVAESLDTLRIQTSVGQVPLANFVERVAVPSLGEITRVDGKRVFTVSADVEEGANANETIETLGEWLKTAELGAITPSFVGDFEEQQESMIFLAQAFAGALGLMFIILLAQFNSFYNSLLVLLAVVFSVGGVLIGMMVMGQPFSVIMTGIGVVALAGIVVNNNIVLIDTYQELCAEMEPIEAIVETGRARLRPVLLTTITTMAGLLPMMFAVSIDFRAGGISVGAPTALWWTQLATAIIFGLGFATVLTLIVTPSLLAFRIWYLGKLPQMSWREIKAASLGRRTEFKRDRSLTRDLRKALRSRRRDDRQIEWEDQPAIVAPAITTTLSEPSVDALEEALEAIEWIEANPPLLVAEREPARKPFTEAAE